MLQAYTLLDVGYGAEHGGAESKSNQAEAELAVAVFASLCEAFPSVGFAGGWY